MASNEWRNMQGRRNEVHRTIELVASQLMEQEFGSLGAGDAEMLLSEIARLQSFIEKNDVVLFYYEAYFSDESIHARVMAYSEQLLSRGLEEEDSGNYGEK